MIFAALLLLGQLGVVICDKPQFPYSSAGPLGGEGTAYEKYNKYPPYCSTPEEMETRAVPPLQSGAIASQLVHVTALIRHGARTPYGSAPNYQCWNGYWDDEETGVWNCDLKTYTSPPAATRGMEAVISNGLLEESPDFLFEKRYDALVGPHGKTGNRLNGTCQLGQLLTRGYDQELRNGLHLRQAYFYDGKTKDTHTASDSRMRLWDLTTSDRGSDASTPKIGDPTKQIYQEPNLRYRADDEQRTLMSGQILLRGLFEPELLSSGDDETTVIRLHTADFSNDVLEINSHICPKLNDVYGEAYSSDEYKKWMDNSMEIKTVNAFLMKEMDMDAMPSSMYDCLMTTICTDRSLPDSLNDYNGSLGETPWEDSLLRNSGESEGRDFTDMFERIANYAIKNFTFRYKYKDAAYSKLGMGPLWKEIMANINPIVDSANNPSTGTPSPKLALFSAHDTTVMPILATLGENVWSGTDWAPYASMILIEIHEITNSEDFPSGYAFRLVYNGKVLTDKMDRCAAGSELCDAQVLAEKVMPFAKYKERDCASMMSAVPDEPSKEEDLVEEMTAAAEQLVAAPGGMWVIMALVVSSMLMGGILVFLLIKLQMKKANGYTRDISTMGGLGMRVMDNNEDNPDIPSVKYGATHENVVQLDENALI